MITTYWNYVQPTLPLSIPSSCPSLPHTLNPKHNPINLQFRVCSLEKPICKHSLRHWNHVCLTHIRFLINTCWINDWTPGELIWQQNYLSALYLHVNSCLLGSNAGSNFYQDNFLCRWANTTGLNMKFEFSHNVIAWGGRKTVSMRGSIKTEFFWKWFFRQIIPV